MSEWQATKYSNDGEKIKYTFSDGINEVNCTAYLYKGRTELDIKKEIDDQLKKMNDRNYKRASLSAR